MPILTTSALIGLGAAKLGAGFMAMGPAGPLMVKIAAGSVVKAAIPALMGQKQQQQHQVSTNIHIIYINILFPIIIEYINIKHTRNIPNKINVLSFRLRQVGSSSNNKTMDIIDLEYDKEWC